MTRADREEIDKRLSEMESGLQWRIACKLLYDLAARQQDLLEFTFNSFVPNPEHESGGASVEWMPKKTKKKKIKRKGVITKETYDLIKEYAQGKDLNSKIFTQNENSMKSALSYLFKIRLKLPWSSHDFRHTMATDLGDRMSVKEVQSYIGHADAKTTLRYMHADSAAVVQKVAMI